MVSESSRTRAKKNTGLLYLNLATVPFEMIPLGMYTAISALLPRFKSIAKILFLKAIRLRFRLDYGIEAVPSQLQFHFEGQTELTED